VLKTLNHDRGKSLASIQMEVIVISAELVTERDCGRYEMAELTAF